MRTHESQIPAHVDAERVRWTVERAWPSGPRVALELSHPDSPHLRAGLYGAGDAHTLLPAGTDPRLPSLAAEASSGVVVSHRLGRRAVVRTHDGRRFTKVVRPGAGAALLQAARAAESVRPHVGLPPILQADDQRLVLGALPGRSLLDLASFDDDTWGRAWSDWSSAWTALAAGAEPLAVSTCHGAEDEAQVLRAWTLKSARVLDPPTHARLSAVVDWILPSLLAGTPAATVLCHRDLHDQQLLWHPDAGIGLLDVDTLTAGEAALDLGNLRAHVALRRLQGFTTASQAATARRAVDETAAGLGVDLGRVRAYEAATSARLVGVYAFRPRWRGVVPRLLDEIERPSSGDVAARRHR